MKPGNLPDAFQSNVAAVDDDAADRRAVTADELGQRVDDDVRAVLDRPHQVGRRQRVVDHQRHAGVVRHVGHGLDVERQQVGVADRLGVDRLGLVGDRLADRFRRRLAELDLDPHLRQGVLEVVVGAAVEAGGRDDLVAGSWRC